MLPGFLSIILFLVIASGWAYALSAMGAIDTKSNGESERKSVQLVDFLALFVVLQTPLMVTSVAVRSHSVGLEVAIIVGLFLTAIFAGMWWRGVTALTSLGIEDWRRRMLCLAVLLPASLVGGVVALPLAVYIPIMFVAGNKLWPTFTGGLILAIVGALVGLGAQWVVAGAEETENRDYLGRDHEPH